jgi:outer membrane protein assembly factor BamB
MARQKAQPIIIGVGGHAVCINGSTGEELWRTKLKGSSFVTVQHEGDRVLVGASGELFCLDARTGSLIWHNKLKGLGLGVVAFTGSSASVAHAALQAQAAAAAAS